MSLGAETQNYTLGRGELYFGRFPGSTAVDQPEELYFGNTPEFNVTIEEEKLDHFSSEEGVREKDDSVSLEVTRSGSFITDNIQPDNVALFFFGSASTVAEAGGAETDELSAVEQGKYYQLGISDSRPVGARGILGADPDSNSSGDVTVADNDSNSLGNTAYVEGTDYELDATLGRIYIIPGGGIADDTDIIVSYTVRASTYDQVISGSNAVEGSLRFIAVNPKGTNFDYYFPHVALSPNGDYALKGDEWQQIPFSVEILKRSDREAIYMNGRPAFS